jgi:hypothetical protein
MGDTWDVLSATALGPAAELQPGSEEEFITEHYWGYTKVGSKTSEYQVEHPAWKVYQIGSYNINVSGEKLYGKELGAVLKGQPTSVFMAEGSEVLVRGGSVLKN